MTRFTKLPEFRRLRMLAIWAALLALVSTSGACSEAKTYSYFQVHITIDPATVTMPRLALVTNCELQVLGTVVNEARILGCRENQVPYDVGTFEWTTDSESGNIQFVVRILDAGRTIVGQAMTAPLAISPGKRSKVELKVVGVASDPPDGGSSDATSADTAPGSDGATTDTNADLAPPIDATPG